MARRSDGRTVRGIMTPNPLPMLVGIVSRKDVLKSLPFGDSTL